ncbi:MAG: GEVED domain-containing protein [Cyanobacteria bacterium J06621_15]
MLNPKLKLNPPHKKTNLKSFDYRSLLIATLFSSSSFLPLFPVLAASPAPGTVIDNQATGSFTDPNNGNTEIQIESNIVQVEVAEVAGITITGIGTEEADNSVNSAGANQGNGETNPDDIIYFKYKITNVGNDPTQFFIPDAPSSINNGTLNGNIQVIEYDPDGASAVDLTGNNITVPTNGNTTGNLLNGVTNTNDGSVPAGGSITIRVPIKVDSNLNDEDKVTVVIGDTPPNDNSAGTQNQVYSANAENKDVYTEDNPDNTAGETNGTPINGDPTNNRQEASASQDVEVVSASPPLTSCPTGSLLAEQTILNFQNPTPEPGTTNGDFSVGAVYRFPNVAANTDALVEVIALNSASIVQLDVTSSGLASAFQPEVRSNSTSPNEYSVDFQIRFVQSGTNTLINLDAMLATSVDTDGDSTVVREFVQFGGNFPNSYTIENPSKLTASQIDSTTVRLESQSTDVNPGINLTTANMGSVKYDKVGIFNYRAGLIIGNNPPPNLSNQRLNSLYFECVSYNNANSTTGTKILDYGDAPDSYGTTNASNGANHSIVNGIHLGNTAPDAEADAATPLDGSGDGAEDDGINLPTLNEGDTSYTIPTSNITATGTGTLHAWLDFDKNGTFEPGEYTSVAVNSGTAAADLSWSNITAGAAGDTYARFRFTTDSSINANTPGGTASDGEVEDYQIEIAANDGNLSVGSPFTCDSTFYITIGPGGKTNQQLYSVDRSGSTYTFNPIGLSSTQANGYPNDFQYNALAYNPLDNYLYAYVQNSKSSTGPYSQGNILKIGTDGVLHSLGKPVGGTLTGSLYAATILSDGTYVVGAGKKFATIDLTTTPPTITNSQQNVSGVNFADFAVDPTDPASASGKRVYGVTEDGQLYIIDMTTFPPKISSQAPNKTGFSHNAGSQFVDAFGTLYYRSNSNQKLYRVNTDSNSPDYGKATEIATAPSGGNHDGASCLFANAMDKEIQDTDGNPITEIPAGETVKYVYKIATGNVIDLNGVTFTDDLRSVSGGSPVNGTFLTDPGKVTVSNGSGNITFDNNDQTLQITNLTLPRQNPATPESEILTITAEVTIPKTTTPGTYLNQSFLTDLPAIYPPSIPSDYPSSAPYEDPTPVEVTEPIANNPNVLLVKRITKINDATTTNGGDDLAIYNQDNSNPYDDNKVDITELPENDGDPKPDTDKWKDTTSDTSSNFLIGGINGGKVEPNDELEYTIYFLSTGDSEAENVLVCDRVPENVSFIPTSFNNQPQATTGLQNSDRGIMWLKDGQQQSLTNTQDGDAAQYFPPGVEPSTIYPKIKCDGANTNGAIVVNLSNLPNATAPGTPDTSYGFIRFKGRVK